MAILPDINTGFKPKKQNDTDLIGKSIMQSKLPNVNSYGGALKEKYGQYAVPQTVKNPNTANIATGAVPVSSTSGGNNYISAAMNNYSGNTNNYSGSNAFGANNIPTRDIMVKAGFDNNKIGWDGKNVTYGGKAVIAPDSVVDGKSYSNTQNIISGINKAYGGNDEMLDVTGATTGQGISNLVEYGADGMVTVGGQPISNVVIMDGQAYAPRSAINAAIKNFRQNSGYKNEGDVYGEFISKNGAEADRLSDRLKNYDKFDYDPGKDVVYQVYQQQYKKNADDAFRDTYGRLANRMGGYANSAAMAVASQAYANQINKINEAIPELARDAYSRYSDDYNRLNDYTQSYYGTPRSNLGVALDAYGATANRIDKSTLANEDRSRYNKEWNLKSRQLEQQIAAAEWQLEYDKSLTPVQKEILQEQIRRAKLENDWYVADISSQIANRNANTDYTRVISDWYGPKTSADVNYTNVKSSLEPTKVKSQVAVNNSTVEKNKAAAKKDAVKAASTSASPYSDILKNAVNSYNSQPTIPMSPLTKNYLKR